MNSDNILIFKDVSFYSSTNTTILENLSFSLNAGDFVAIVGPNGAGKTTLFKLILGMLKPNTGTITFPLFEKSKSIGYVPQVKTLDKNFPATVLELVCSGITNSWNFFINKSMKQQALEVLESIDAKDLALKPLAKLSGGELQRVYLARAIIRKPRLLLLDEPSTGIDFVCENEIEKIILELNNVHNTTIMMITHDISSAYHHSNKVLLLNKSIVAYNTPKESLTDNNIMLAYSNHNHSHNIKVGLKL